MRFVSFKKDNERRLGIKTEKGILDLQIAGNYFQEQVPDSLEEFIRHHELAGIENIVARAEEAEIDSIYLSEEEISFAPGILAPEKIICVGLNYDSHIEETKIVDKPKEPILFSKFNNALAAHHENVPIPDVGEKFDYEAELVIVIGKKAKNVTEAEALSYVFGYTAGNDLSVRDLQFKSGQWLIGKSLDKFAPVGPYIVTSDEIDPGDLDIETKLNGVTVQSSNTKYMIFNCATIVSYISKHMTLEPGDLIFTGTPEGVILGSPEEQQVWLKSGDELEVTIENIGTLKNTMI